MSEYKKKNNQPVSAIALKYEPDKNNAPCIVAAGTGFMAEKILQVAEENGINIYHDDSAAALLSKLNIGQEIPPELYQIVADIYVYILGIAEETKESHL